MSVQQVLRAVTVEDMALMELGELEALLQRGHAALIFKAKQTMQASNDKAALAEQQRQALLKFEPQIVESFASKPVKLNVGGTYFSTSLENLTREPNTFFSAMFSGRWDINVNPKDDAVFVDRDPAMFGAIINYLRDGSLYMDDLSPCQLKALCKEVDFYQIPSLLELFPKPTLSARVKGTAQLSRDHLRVSTAGVESASHVISACPFSPSVREMTVKLVKGNHLMIGVAPALIVDPNQAWASCGWYVYAVNGFLYSQSGDNHVPFKRPIQEGSTITVKLDLEYNVSFVVDGVHWGVAYASVPKNLALPLHLALIFTHDPAKKNHKHIVQLV